MDACVCMGHLNMHLHAPMDITEHVFKKILTQQLQARTCACCHTVFAHCFARAKIGF
jgi:hypothetical protein